MAPVSLFHGNEGMVPYWDQHETRWEQRLFTGVNGFLVSPIDFEDWTRPYREYGTERLDRSCSVPQTRSGGYLQDHVDCCDLAERDHFELFEVELGEQRWIFHLYFTHLARWLRHLAPRTLKNGDV